MPGKENSAVISSAVGQSPCLVREFYVIIIIIIIPSCVPCPWYLLPVSVNISYLFCTLLFIYFTIPRLRPSLASQPFPVIMNNDDVAGGCSEDLGAFRFFFKQQSREPKREAPRSPGKHSIVGDIINGFALFYSLLRVLLTIALTIYYGRADIIYCFGVCCCCLSHIN